MGIQELINKQLQLINSESFIQERMLEDPSMISYFDIIKDINQHYFLTTNSQAGHLFTLDDNQVQERAYLCGIMLSDMANDFIKEFSISSDKVVGEVVITSTDTIPIPVTISKCNNLVNTHTYARFSIYPEEADMEFKIIGVPEQERKNYVFILCYDTIWCRDARDGLFKDVLYALQKINLNK